MSILHQRKDTEELHVLDPVNLLEIFGLHVQYISLIRRIIGNFIFLPVYRSAQQSIKYIAMILVIQEQIHTHVPSFLSLGAPFRSFNRSCDIL